MKKYHVEVDSVSKVFRVHYGKNQTLKEKILYAGRTKYKEFIALDNVSLKVETGSTVGIIGVNGSGKSTLLKIISKILYPDKGQVKVNGRVASLLELGAGFHPDFTGRENIYLNGSLMGLSKKQIGYKIDEIIEFSELGDFIKEPIRTYSSGMYMRLAFSVATALDPEILLIDEILAVGDAAFQKKCMDRLKQLQKLGKSIIFVSHNSTDIENFCDVAVWLDHSKVREIGDPRRCVGNYLRESMNRANQGNSTLTFDHSIEAESD